MPNGYELCALVTPAAWTAADITFQASADATTFGDAFDDGGTEYESPSPSDQYLSIPEGEIRGALALKVRSGVTATPVNQAAARTITLVFKPV